jgi:acetolactate synthase I/III small subunit
MNNPTVEREVALLKVYAPAVRRAEIIALARAFEAKVVDVGSTTLTIELAGLPGRVDKLVELLRPFGLKELMRTGRVVMVRAPHPTATAPGDGELVGEGAPAAPWLWQADGAA